EDIEQSIINNTLSFVADTTYPLNIGDNVLTIPSNSTTLTTSATVEEIIGNPISKTLMETTLSTPLTGASALTNATINYNNTAQKLMLDMGTVNQFTKDNSIFASYITKNITNGTTMNPINVSGNSMFANQTIDLPDETLGLWFDNTQNELEVAATITYRENFIQSPSNFSKNIFLQIENNTSQYIGSINNRLQLVSSPNNLSSFEVIGGTYMSNGDIANLKLKNV